MSIEFKIDDSPKFGKSIREKSTQYWSYRFKILPSEFMPPISQLSKDYIF